MHRRQFIVLGASALVVGALGQHWNSILDEDLGRAKELCGPLPEFVSWFHCARVVGYEHETVGDVRLGNVLGRCVVEIADLNGFGIWRGIATPTPGIVRRFDDGETSRMVCLWSYPPGASPILGDFVVVAYDSLLERVVYGREASIRRLSPAEARIFPVDTIDFQEEAHAAPWESRPCR